jgi:FHS family Na+ dependent glucose MFS transporter 1
MGSSDKTLFKRNEGALSKTAVYFASYVALGLVMGVIGPTLPSLADQTRSRLSEISFLFTAHSFGYLVGSLLGGRFYDRRPGHPVIMLSLFLMLSLLILVPLMPLLLLLSAVLLVLGLAEGVLDVGGNTLLVWVHRSRVGPFMNGLHFSFGFGAFISPLIVAQVIKLTGGINWAFWSMAFIILPIALSVLRLPSPEIHRPPEESGSKGSEMLFVGFIAFFFFLHVGGELSFGGWIFTYAVTVELADKFTAAYLTSLFWGSLTLGRLLGVPIASFVKPRYILIGNLIGCLLGISIILLWTHSSVALWAGTGLTGLSMASIFPASLTYAERHIHISGRITSWFLIGASVGSMFLPWFIGQFFESIGPHVTMIVLVVDFAVALGVLLITFRIGVKKQKLKKGR